MNTPPTDIPNPPAFPTPSGRARVKGYQAGFGQYETTEEVCQTGMLLRDYLAAQTLAGLVPVWNDRGSTFAVEIAKSAYEIADAMLAERVKK